MKPVEVRALVAVDANGSWYVEGSSDFVHKGPNEGRLTQLAFFREDVAEMGMAPPVRVSWITAEVPAPLTVDPAPIACVAVEPAEFTEADAAALERQLELVTGAADVRFRDVQTANLVRLLLANYKARVAADRGAGA